MKYFDELKRSMEFLAADPRVVFMGQAVAVPGTALSNTLRDVAPGRLIELPVAEEMQMGMTTGLALAGQGWRAAMRHDAHLRQGLNVAEGQLTHEAVARSLGLPWVAAETLLAAG